MGSEIAKRKAIWLYPKVLGFNPSERWGHSACYSHGFVYVFGGCCGGMHFDDILALDLKTMSWKPIVTTGQGPGPRDSHSAVLVGNKMVVFGGTNGTKKVNDIHILDIDSKEWTRPECRGTPPTPRESHTATLVGDEKLVIFGGSGEGGSNYLSDLHVLDLKTMSWATSEVKGDMPFPRDSHGAFAIGKKLFVYGGDSGDRYHGDIDMLDMDSLTWSRVEVCGASPGVRAGHATVNIGTKVYVIGGVGDKRYYNDVWVFDVTNCSWSQLEICGQQPQGRFSHTAIVLDSDIAIYGGCGEDERPLHELLVLHLGSDHPNGRYNISMCKMFGNNLVHGKRRFLKEPERNSKATVYTNNVEGVAKHDQEPRLVSKESLQAASDTLHPKRRRTSNNMKVLEIQSDQEEHSLSLSHHSSPSQSDQEHTPRRKTGDPLQVSCVFPSFSNQIQPFPKRFIRMVEHRPLDSGSVQNMIGAEVHGKVDASFDSGYLMTATVNGKIFRGVLFPPALGFESRGAILDLNTSSSTSNIAVSRLHSDKIHADSTLSKPFKPGHVQMSRPCPVNQTRSTSLNNRDRVKIRSDLQGVVLSLGGPGSGLN